MASEDEKHQIIVLEPISETTQKLLEAVEKNDKVEITRTPDAVEAITYAKSFVPCLAILGLTQNQDIVQCVTFLKAVAKESKKGRIKIMQISAFKSPQLSAVAQKLFVTDFIEEPIPARTLTFKMNLQIKALEAQKKKESAARLADEEIVLKEGEKQNKGEELEPVRKKSLTSDKDSFLFKNNKVRKKKEKFTLEMEGPDPSTGKWKEHEPTEDGASQWRWVPDDPEAEENKCDPKEPEGWVAEGEKPVFNKTSNQWQFNGKKPNLSYVKKKEKVATKVSTNENGEVEVAEDSEQAEAKVAALRKTSGDPASKEINNKTDEGKSEEHKKNLDLKKDADGKEIKAPNDKLSKTDDGAGKGLNKLEKTNDDHEVSAGDLKDKTGEVLAKDAEGMALKKSDDPKATELNKDGLKKDDQVGGAAELKKNLDKDATIESPQKNGLKKSAQENAKGPNALKKSDPKEAVAGKLNEGEVDEEDKLKQRDGEVNRDKLGELKKDAASAGDPNALKSIDPKKAEELKKKTLDAAEDRKKLNALKDKLNKDEEALAGEDGYSPEKVKKKAELKKKKALMNQLEREMQKPVPNELDDLERERIEEDFGLKKKEKTDKELGELDKGAKLKALKKQLAEGDDEAGDILASDEEKKKGLNRGQLRKDEDKNTQSNRAFEEEERKGINARDSDVEDGEVDWDAKNEKLSPEEKKIQESEEDGRKVFTLQLDELNLKDGGWERTGSWYVFLSPETRYHGFETLESLLPIWIYGGDSKPEFLAKSTTWRFYDVKPKRCSKMEKVPNEVQEYLVSLNNTIQENKEKNKLYKDKEEEETAGEEEKDNSEIEEAQKERLKALMSKTDEDLAREAEEQGFDPAEYRKRMKEERAALGDKYEDELEKLRAEREAELAKKRAEGDSEDDKLSALKDMLGKTEEELADSSPDEIAAELAALKEKSKDFEDGADDLLDGMDDDDPDAKKVKEKLAALKDKLDDEDPSALNESNEIAQELEKIRKAKQDKMDKYLRDQEKLQAEIEAEKKEFDEMNDPVKRMQKKAEEDERKRQEEDLYKKENSKNDELADKLANKNAEAADFLEKRKNRLKEEEKNKQLKLGEMDIGRAQDSVLSDFKDKKAGSESTLESVLGDTLGIDLFISDAIFDQKSIFRKADRLIGTIADRFGNTRVLIMQHQDKEHGKVFACTDTSFTKGAVLDITGKSEEFSGAAMMNKIIGKNGEVLGYLVLSPISPRVDFDEQDKELLNSIAILVAKYWEAVAVTEGEKAA